MVNIRTVGNETGLNYAFLEVDLIFGSVKACKTGKAGVFSLNFNSAGTAGKESSIRIVGILVTVVAIILTGLGILVHKIAVVVVCRNAEVVLVCIYDKEYCAAIKIPVFTAP